MSDYEFEIWQDGIMVAGVQASDLNAARREAMHYAMVYAQDGPVEVRGKDAHRLIDTPPAPNPRKQGAEG